MSIEVLKPKHLLFEEDVKLTGIKDYGFSWEDFSEQKKPIPAEGLRFDISFEGSVTGNKINGTIKGIDYLTVRADGRLFLDLHAEITTNDGASISVKESGINANGLLLLNMDFHTSSEEYKWINHQHVWGEGTVDFTTGAVKIKGYTH